MIIILSIDLNSNQSVISVMSVDVSGCMNKLLFEILILYKKLTLKIQFF